MLDISARYTTLRTATAEANVKVDPKLIQAIRREEVPKGDPLTAARIAGIMAAKRTWDIIPFCHPITLASAKMLFDLKADNIGIRATIKAVAPTGVEMEALTAVSVAALTIYDMLKPLKLPLEIGGVRLLSKLGGRRSFASKPEKTLTAGVLVLSDSIAEGGREDKSGPIILMQLEAEGIEVRRFDVLSDDREGIVKRLCEYADVDQLDLVITTGGTGPGPRDNTPEAMSLVLDRVVPGISEALREYGRDRTPYAMFSRGKAGFRGNTLIINIPGSAKAVSDSMRLLFPAIFHIFSMLNRKSGWDSHIPEDMK